MKLLLNYAANGYMNAQRQNSNSGTLKGGFDRVQECGVTHMDINFITKNTRILRHERGAGYWLWKPYIILKYLKTLNEGDYLFYCDSGSVFINSVDHLIALNQDITVFHLDPVAGNKETLQTKRDCFVIMGCEDPKYMYTLPRHAGFQLYRKCNKSIEFVSEYLEYCQDERLITDQDNVMWKPNYHEFRNHRHDQSIFSLLTKIHNLPSFRDPTQYGNPYIQPGEYPQIINHTRLRI